VTETPAVTVRSKPLVGVPVVTSVRAPEADTPQSEPSFDTHPMASLCLSLRKTKSPSEEPVSTSTALGPGNETEPPIKLASKLPAVIMPAVCVIAPDAPKNTVPVAGTVTSAANVMFRSAKRSISVLLVIGPFIKDHCSRSEATQTPYWSSDGTADRIVSPPVRLILLLVLTPISWPFRPFRGLPQP
jgi:hypothetical protein